VEGELLTDAGQTAYNTRDLLIIGEFGEGAFGPTILLKLLSERSAEWLRSTFTRLAENPDVTPDLAGEPLVEIGGVRSLVLRHTSQAEDVVLRQVPAPDGGLDFVWETDSESWAFAAGLMEPFVTGRTGHQYLTREGIDAALIEVSFGEPQVRIGGRA